MGDFGTKYDKYRSTKDHRQDPATKNVLERQQENNAIFKHEVDEIILQENKKWSVKDEHTWKTLLWYWRRRAVQDW